MKPMVVAVSRSADHRFSKSNVPSIELVSGLGAQGDAHQGVRVKHRSRVAKDPSQPNLRQVHLIHHELLEELNGSGFQVTPGSLGENITTQGIKILELPVDTELQLGNQARIRITGLRNPCAQLDKFQSGLTAAVLEKDAQGQLVRKAGVMAVVIESGVVQAQDTIEIAYPDEPHIPLAVV